MYSWIPYYDYVVFTKSFSKTLISSKPAEHFMIQDEVINRV